MRNVLITQGNLGDVVCCIPAAEQIKRNRPDIHLAVICPGEYEGLFLKNPFVDAVNLPIQRDDQVYGMRWPLTDRERSLPFVGWFARLAGLGKLDNPLPTLYGVLDEEIDWPFAEDDVVVAVGPRTRWPTRNWPEDRYAQVLDTLKTRHAVRIVAVGRKSADPEGYLQLADASYMDTSIRKTAAALARCDLFLGNDSGLAHLAAACRTTSFTVFGPVHHRTHSHPGWTVPIQSTSACHGCLTDGRALNFPVERFCPRDSECLRLISPEQVLGKVIPFILDCKKNSIAPAAASFVPDRAQVIEIESRPPEIQDAPRKDLSILVCCYRFLQRFRVFLSSLSHQTLDRSRFEVVVANPGSPDGLSQYLEEFNRGGAAVVPGVGRLAPEVIEVQVSEAYRRNRGYMIQRAFEASRGRVIMAADGDIILHPDFLRQALAELGQAPNAVLGVYRNFLSPGTSAQIIAGLLNPIRNFDALRHEDFQEESGYRGVLGYCQIVSREAFSRVGYPEEFDKINQSDIEFVNRLQAIGVYPRRLDGQTVLHLHHERNWEGVTSYM